MHKKNQPTLFDLDEAKALFELIDHFQKNSISNVPIPLKEKQVAILTGDAVQTLRNRRCKGIGIPYYKNGRNITYSLQDVIDYMDKKRIDTDTE